MLFEKRGGTLYQLMNRFVTMPIFWPDVLVFFRAKMTEPAEKPSLYILETFEYTQRDVKTTVNLHSVLGFPVQGSNTQLEPGGYMSTV